MGAPVAVTVEKGTGVRNSQEGASVTLANEESVPHKAKLVCPQGFGAELTINRVKDGLLALEVTVSWQVPRERVPRRFALFLLKAKPDLALAAAWRPSIGWPAA